MENKRNYQKELEKIIEKIDPVNPPSLFLHACCAPCSSYCMEYLCKYFKITVFFYNPNITLGEEYEHRVKEEKRLIACYNEEMSAGKREGIPISIMEGNYDPERFYEMAKGLENCPEGGERCFRCYELRLLETVQTAIALKNENIDNIFDYYSTTLTISPLKNAQKLNEIGERLSSEYGLKWLPSDFKKKNGYKRSIELSAEYDLYRQDFCGCIYSKVERQRANEKRC